MSDTGDWQQIAAVTVKTFTGRIDHFNTLREAVDHVGHLILHSQQF